MVLLEIVSRDVNASGPVVLRTLGKHGASPDQAQLVPWLTKPTPYAAPQSWLVPSHSPAPPPGVCRACLSLSAGVSHSRSTMALFLRPFFWC